MHDTRHHNASRFKDAKMSEIPPSAVHTGLPGIHIVWVNQHDFSLPILTSSLRYHSNLNISSSSHLIELITMAKTKKSRGSAARTKAIATTGSVNENEVALKIDSGLRVIHYAIIWVVVVGLTFIVTASRNRVDILAISDDAGTNITKVLAETAPAGEVDGGDNGPTGMLGRFGSYPNLLNITDEERDSFHPVVKFPKIWMDDKDEGGNNNRKQVSSYQILDLTTIKGADQLASVVEREERRAGKKGLPQQIKGYAIGRYDENRVNLYSSALFADTSNDISGFTGVRTVHVGVDLDGPLGTKVFAFTHGIIHKLGYNAELGDYGNVIVVEHYLKPGNDGKERKIYALYGHLDGKSIKGKREGQKIKKGQVIGRIGDIHENGGW